MSLPRKSLVWFFLVLGSLPPHAVPLPSFNVLHKPGFRGLIQTTPPRPSLHSSAFRSSAGHTSWGHRSFDAPRAYTHLPNLMRLRGGSEALPRRSSRIAAARQQGKIPNYGSESSDNKREVDGKEEEEEDIPCRLPTNVGSQAVDAKLPLGGGLAAMEDDTFDAEDFVMPVRPWFV